MSDGKKSYLPMWAFAQIVTLSILMGLKIGGVVDCEWFYIFMPLWTPFAFILALVALVFTFVIVLMLLIGIGIALGLFVYFVVSVIS